MERDAALLLEVSILLELQRRGRKQRKQQGESNFLKRKNKKNSEADSRRYSGTQYCWLSCRRSSRVTHFSSSVVDKINKILMGFILHPKMDAKPKLGAWQPCQYCPLSSNPPPKPGGPLPRSKDFVDGSWACWVAGQEHLTHRGWWPTEQPPSARKS